MVGRAPLHHPNATWLAKALRLNAFSLQLGAQRFARSNLLASSDAPAALWMPYPPCPASQKTRVRGCPSQSPCRRRARTSAALPRCARGGGFGTWSILRCGRCPWPRPALRAPRRVDGWVGIGRRAQQLARIGFEVKALVNANHGRPMAGVHPLGHGKRESGAPARLQPDGRHTRHGGHHIRPGARSIDDGAAPQLPAIGQRHVPGIPFFASPPPLPGSAPARPLAQAAQVALVQRMHVDVSRLWLAHASGHGLGFQARQLGQQRRLVHPLHIGDAARASS